METGKVLITSARPCRNLMPHLGTPVGFILSTDVYAACCKVKGEDVVAINGSDENDAHAREDLATTAQTRTWMCRIATQN